MSKIKSLPLDVKLLRLGLDYAQTRAQNEDISTFADDQSDLDARIEALTNDYNTKFGSMEAMVTQLNKTGEYLTSMMDAWNKKD